jgi:hypothetical protein
MKGKRQKIKGKTLVPSAFVLEEENKNKEQKAENKKQKTFVSWCPRGFVLKRKPRTNN